MPQAIVQQADELQGIKFRDLLRRYLEACAYQGKYANGKTAAEWAHTQFKFKSDAYSAVVAMCAYPSYSVDIAMCA